MTPDWLQQFLFWKNLIFWFLNVVGFVSILSVSKQAWRGNTTSTVSVAVLLGVVLAVLLGMFPVPWGSGADRESYASSFLEMQHLSLHQVLKADEYGFVLINWILGKFLTIEQHFVAIALIYVGNYLLAAKKLVRHNVYWLFIGVVLSFGFVSYGLNTLRAGLALSFLVLGLSRYPSLWRMAVFMFIAYTIHHSTIIPSLMIVISYFYNRTRYFYYLWFLAVPLSLFAGGYFNVLFATFSDDSRVGYLTNTDTHYNIGFRIDFVIFSVAPLIVGAYYIFKRKLTDPFYHMLYNAYVLTNIFWVLVIRSNFSDRFAYLSWFMLPFVLLYPLLKHDMKLNVSKWLMLIYAAEIAFRFVL